MQKPESSKMEKQWWKELWRMKIPPGLKIFWWQVYWNILPIEGNLVRHHVSIHPSCGLCGYSKASTIHAIFLCSNIKEVWKEMAIVLPEGPELEQDPLEFLDCLLYYNQGLSKELIVTTAWGIWKRRCDNLHNSST